MYILNIHSAIKMMTIKELKTLFLKKIVDKSNLLKKKVIIQ